MLGAFFAYYRPHRALFLADFGCAVLSGLLELGFPLAVKAFVDVLLPAGDWPLIQLAAASLVAIYALNAALSVVVTYWGHKLGINIETAMRAKAFAHLQTLSFKCYDERKTGHLVARVTKDLEEIGEVAHHGPEALFIAVMTFVGAFALMLAVHVELALLTALIVPVSVFVVTRYGARMTQNWQAQFGRVGHSMRGWRRISAASASSRRSPTRPMRRACSPATTSASGRPSSKPTPSWRPARR